MMELDKGEFPIIIKPNLGQPILLNLRDYKDSNDKLIKNIVFDAIILTLPQMEVERILEYFHLNLYIQPILKCEGEFQNRRGELIPLQVIEIEHLKKLNQKNGLILEEKNCIISDIHENLLKLEDTFGKRNFLYEIKVQIQYPSKVEDLIKNYGNEFILFDIVHDVPNQMENKTNYHSIAIFDKSWEDFKFIHVTDLHIARRNDFILNFVQEKVKSKLRRVNHREKKAGKIDKSVLTREYDFREGFQEEKFEKLRISKFNFNYHLRKFIEFANKKAGENQLDFILMTGDLVDYTNIARGNYQYKNNYFVILDILLGLNKGLDKPPYLGDNPEFVNKCEILVPIFTTVGNHDYRREHYGIRFGEVRKIFGMTQNDINGYYDIKFFNYITALYSNERYLKDYFRYFNPNLNYNLNIGAQFSFIFLDTGPESIADLHDLLKGGPSTKGVKDYQIDLLRDYIRLSHDKKIIIVMHTPPVSPNLSRAKRKKYKKRLKIKNRELDWQDLYEENLKDYDGTGRLDRILNLKYQTVMYHWGTLLKIFTGSDKIIRRKVDLIICGHTHTLKEYRLKEAKDTEWINLGFWIFPLYIEVPCEIYTSIYRDKFNELKEPLDLKIWFDVNKPFVFQTQALGPISATFKFTPPGFRYYIVKNNQIVNARVYSLHLI
jgi:predicted MPP superfamily phosphohydrolase